MESASIFSTDAVQINSCVVQKLANWKALLIQHEKNSVALLLDSNEKVGVGDLVTSQWVLDYLNIKPNTKVALKELSLINMDCFCSVNLVYIAHWNQRHWDEVPFGNPIDTPFAWNSKWPAELNIYLFEKSCQYLLCNTVFCEGAAIAVKALDTTLLFLVSLSGINYHEDTQPRQTAVLSSINSKYKIIFNSDNQRTSKCKSDSVLNVEESHSTIPEIYCFVPIINDIITLCDMFFKSAHEVIRNEIIEQQTERFMKGMIKSILLSAPEGGGKSYVLNYIAEYTKSRNRLNRFEYSASIYCLSCKDIIINMQRQQQQSNRMNNDFSASVVLTTTESQQPLDREIDEAIAVLLELSGEGGGGRYHSNNNSSNNTVNKHSNILFLLDDMDYIFSQYRGSSNGGGNSSKESEGEDDDDAMLFGYSIASMDIEQVTACKQLGYALYRLLQLLSRPQCSARVLIIGTTRLPAYRLPQSHSSSGGGCPEFEKCVQLPSPSFEERAVILQSALNSRSSNGNNSVSSLYVLDKLLLLPFEPTNKLVIDQQQQVEEDNTIGSNGTSTNNISLSNDIDSNNNNNDEIVVNQWSTNLAGLTAGYLPGDLMNLLQKMELIHRGKSAAATATSSSFSSYQQQQQQQQSSFPPQRRSVMTWNTALEAVLCTTPKQLQSLSSVQSTTTTASSASGRCRLNWQDFAGYDKIVNELRRRLTLQQTVQEQQQQQCILSTTAATLTTTTATTTTPLSGWQQLQLKGAATSPRGVLLHGPTGCGKTLLARVITSELKMNILSVRSPDLLSRYFGQTENTIRRIFSKARSAAPCVLFFDDFDCLAYKRSGSDDNSSSSSSSNGLHGRVLSTFLNELDGIISNNNNSNDLSSLNSGLVLVIAACRDISVLDEALLRPGRLQHHVLLDSPNREDVKNILHYYLSKMPCELNIAGNSNNNNNSSSVDDSTRKTLLGDDITVVDDNTATSSKTNLSLDAAIDTLYNRGASGADVECFAKNALMNAIRCEINAIESGSITEEDSSSSSTPVLRKKMITQEHIDMALKTIVTTDYYCTDNNNNNNSKSDFIQQPVQQQQLPSTFTWSSETSGFSIGSSL